MVFKRKKKIKEEIVEETQEKTSYLEGPYILLELMEIEKGSFEASKVKIIEAKRILRISNRSSIPIFDINLMLKNAEKTTLSRRISLKKLNPYGREGSMHEVSYDVKSYMPPISLTTNIMIPNLRGNVVWHNTENDVYLTINIKPNVQTVIGKVLIEYIPGIDVVDVITEAPVTKQGDRIVLELENLQSQVVSQKFALKVKPSDSQKAKLGEIRVKVALKNGTFSGVSIEDFDARILVPYDIEKQEHEDKPGVWDIGISIRNPYDIPIKAFGEIELPEKILSTPDYPNIQRKQNKLIIKEIEVSPHGSAYIGPISVETVDIPQIRTNIEGKIKSEIIMQAEGEYTLKLPSLQVAAVALKKKVQPIVDVRLRKYVGENEIPSLGNNRIEVATNVMNIGSVDLNYIEISETIPPGFSEPENISLNINGKRIQNFEKQVVGEGNIQYERKLIIRLKGKSIFPKASTLTLKYQLTPKKLDKSMLEIPFPSTVSYSPYIEVQPKIVSLAEAEAPYVRVKFIARNVRISKEITPVDTDEFLLKILVENRGNAPIVDCIILQRLPSEFEIVESYPKAEKTTEGNISFVKWKIDLEPNKTMELSLRIRGKGEFSIRELQQMETKSIVGISG